MGSKWGTPKPRAKTIRISISPPRQPKRIHFDSNGKSICGKGDGSNLSIDKANVTCHSCLGLMNGSIKNKLTSAIRETDKSKFIHHNIKNRRNY